ncbi:MAG TPA: RidA family protein [Phycicoccus sp.]|nr:RidA family protein [Phycicoccus sp.]HQY95437.1 RidA family protein [Phycicoccus sp.]HRA43828.1 RidA family protein [Phycicoccus sp.]
MSLSHVNPPDLGTPSGFSHAVVGEGRIVFLAGQTALSPEGVIVGDGVVEQFERALTSILTSLRAAGGGPEHLASLTIYIVDMEDYKSHGREIGAVWRRLIGRNYPAMAGIGVSRLWDIEALVEVQGFAVIPPAADSV